MRAFEWPIEAPPIVVVGPTAAGKTDTAIHLAMLLDGEIVNADSVQVYRGLDIGSAKPARESRRGVPFHLIDIRDPDDPVTVADWKRGAELAISGIIARGKRPIVCGGTGMYVRALLQNWGLTGTGADAGVREELENFAAAHGLDRLYARLQTEDPDSAERIHPNDRVRIVRALEVGILTGKPFSKHAATDSSVRSERPALIFGLTMAREELNRRIDRRVDTMLAQGLESEVRSLLERGYGRDLRPMQTLGYKEVAAHLVGDLDRAEMVAAIKLNTRRFAKRQHTWFRADIGIRWMNAADLGAAELATAIASAVPEAV